MSATDTVPLQPLAIGGHRCTANDECGEGSCSKFKCHCKDGFVGPTCLVNMNYSGLSKNLSVYIIRNQHQNRIIMTRMFVRMVYKEISKQKNHGLRSNCAIQHCNYTCENEDSMREKEKMRKRKGKRDEATEKEIGRGWYQLREKEGREIVDHIVSYRTITLHH